MSGIFYGVGVGPGDPELLTLKAIKIIKECDVLAVAVSAPDFLRPEYEEVPRERAETESTERKEPETGSPFHTFLEKCMAYRIALAAVPEIAEKAKLFLPMPMKKDKAELKQIHDLGAEAAAKILCENRSMAFITLGDPSVYSTCLYIQKRLCRLGYKTCLVPGIPSFCAAAARLNEGLAENREELHILPASYGIEEGLEQKGTKVLMKAGKKMPYVKEVVRQRGLHIRMVENCGMESEQVYESVEEIPDEASYYSLLIVKE